MFIIEVIPLTKPSRFQPAILTYYFTVPIETGFLVLIPMRKQEKYGIVISCAPLTNHKLAIKNASFQLKKITSIASEAPVLKKWQIEFGMWMANYYCAPIGSIFLKMLKLPLTPTLSLKGRGSYSNPKKISQILILIPQISKIQSTVNALSKTADITIIHNKLTDKQRAEAWERIKTGQAEYIVGTRSAIFMPFANLKKIIIKEEENQHYKSQKTPRFDARTAVIKLSELTGAKLVFESAAPRAEDYYFLTPYPSPQPSPFPKEKGRGSFLEIKNIKNKNIEIKIVDIQKEHAEKNYSIFSRELQMSLKEFIRAKKQVILFSARRGGANFIICKDCQNVLKCPNCEKTLSYHLSVKNKLSQLICHVCGHIEKPPALCPKCHGHQIKFSGFGAEKLEMEIKKLFPKVNVGRIDGDISPKKRLEIVEKFNNKEIQILLGTQAIFSYDFTPAPLVSAVSFDILLHIPDFRASERIFQQITYLKNLSSEKLIIQTSSPDNYAIRCAADGDYKKFYSEEIKIRKDFDYPPFSKLIKLTYRHTNKIKAEVEAIKLAEQLKKIYEVLGPAPAFMPKKNNLYYWNIIIKLKDNNCKLPTIPDWTVDIEPENLL